ncbi:DUF4335 domain-containing protein [Merismopedia glauca]|uniref:DUF4335 domain-containing protein n=1 Tax=Merismopedia glauca CCAP 1448/3 TaxID=1296344 RepID=A0A2T1C8A9_9CYAN|nr:DUF4335 domain-containing protein [Merismopedia glauca]PSB04500.1 hypothetical protein C7B64_03515 [Merismopedia glauca CCAP 1448/3]
MTIQRRYSLPNCNLLLEGLGDLTGNTQLVNRPAMSILVNAECQLPRLSQPISGGRKFLESLITSVSSYTQELLSGIPQPISSQNQSTLVRLQKGKNSDSHLLSVYPEPAEGSNEVDTNPTQEIELTTVELFDVLEAIDQLLADTSTLPDLSLSLKPVSKRYAVTHNSLNKRLKPVALGLTGLAVAGISSYLLPVPKVQPPKSTPVENSSTSPSPTPPLVTNTQSQAEITDVKVVQAIQKQVQEKLGANWTNKAQVKEDLVYQVNVDQKGQIVSYEGKNKLASSSAKLTPLPALLSKSPPNTKNAAQIPVVKLKAVFKSSGKLEVAPWSS